VDEYLAAVDDDQRTALEDLREQILGIVPDAVERISYGIVTFAVGGTPLVGLGATKNHCAFYLMSSTVLDGFAERIEGLESSKGTIRFQPGDPLPSDLVRDLVTARIAENTAKKP
jgi:uncharacterized protein YdhG (YjbR/CyaY superfamily)